MTRPKKILVPVDLSERSEAGVVYGAMLARSLDSELVLMINVNLPEREILENFVTIEHTTIDEAAESALNRLVYEHGKDLTSSVSVSFEHDPAEAVLKSVEADGVDMIVIASHGRSGMSRWMLGSVADKILRSASVPVVVIPTRD